MPAWKEASAEESASGLNDIKSNNQFWKVPSGQNGKWAVSRIRIMPPHVDSPSSKYYTWVATHGGLPGSSTPIYCPQKNDNKPCPACERGNLLWNQGDKAEARKFFSSWRGFVNVIVLTPEGEIPDEAEIKVWGMPKTLLEDLESKIAELPAGTRNIASPTAAGRDIFVRRKGTGTEDTKYEITPAPEQSAFPDLDRLEELMEVEGAGLRLLTTGTYPRPPAKDIAGLLVAAKPQDSFEDDDDEVPFRNDDAIDGDFAIITEPSSPPNPFGDDDDDDARPDDNDPDADLKAGLAASAAKSSGVSAARQRLLEKMGS